jgi:hypothetical protein
MNALELNKQAFAKICIDNNIHHIEINYDFSDGDGEIEAVYVFDNNKEEIDVPLDAVVCHYSKGTFKGNFENLIEELTWTMLYSQHPCLDDCYGTIIMYSDGTGSIDHNQRIFDVENCVSKF